MWAVYLCGCTDCFMHALFFSKEDAEEWAKSKDINPEGYFIKYVEKPEELDRSDTGWYTKFDEPYVKARRDLTKLFLEDLSERYTNDSCNEFNLAEVVPNHSVRIEIMQTSELWDDKNYTDKHTAVDNRTVVRWLLERL